MTASLQNCGKHEIECQKFAWKFFNNDFELCLSYFDMDSECYSFFSNAELSAGHNETGFISWLYDSNNCNKAFFSSPTNWKFSFVKCFVIGSSIPLCVGFRNKVARIVRGCSRFESIVMLVQKMIQVIWKSGTMMHKFIQRSTFSPP